MLWSGYRVEPFSAISSNNCMSALTSRSLEVRFPSSSSIFLFDIFVSQTNFSIAACFSASLICRLKTNLSLPYVQFDNPSLIYEPTVFDNELILNTSSKHCHHSVVNVRGNNIPKIKTTMAAVTWTNLCKSISVTPNKSIIRLQMKLFANIHTAY